MRVHMHSWALAKAAVHCMQPVISNVCSCPGDSREPCMYMQVYGLHGGVVRSFLCHIHGVCVCNGLELRASQCYGVESSWRAFCPADQQMIGN